MQRHHLLPLQLQRVTGLQPMLRIAREAGFDFDDFRSNGLLLPANDDAAVRAGLPLHRGPHRDYNALVIERAGQIERGWSQDRLRAPEVALVDALNRLVLLQRALRRRLLAQRRRFVLNRFDPLGSGYDFNLLDAMADTLWPATEPDS